MTEMSRNEAIVDARAALRALGWNSDEMSDEQVADAIRLILSRWFEQTGEIMRALVPVFEEAAQSIRAFAAAFRSFETPRAP